MGHQKRAILRIKNSCKSGHLILFFLLIVQSITAQNVSSCTNSDFELGDFTGWQGQTGSCCPVSTAPSGIIAGRHTIMSGTGTDPLTCDNVSVVAPGGTYSARIGNSQVGAEAEKLSYSLTVTPTSSLFIYKYAIVLEDPGHPESEQPRFQVSIINSAGTLIDPTCGEYTVVASSNLEGFETCGAVVYKDWTTVGLDLTPYLGQTITIEFATGDCTPGGHFGYAYVDAYCSPLQIAATYCSGSYEAVLTAPIGFTYSWNTGETTQAINVTNPIGGQTYTCTLTSVTGCTVNISTVLNADDPIADFAITNTCYNRAVFANTSYIPGNQVLDAFLWDFGDGTTSTDENPTHVFSGVGTYTVQYSIGNGIGCASVISHVITVYPFPTAAISYSGTPFCSTITALQPVTLSGTNDYLGGVFSASPAGLAINPTTGSIDAQNSTAGNYIVSYAIPTTADNCTVLPVTTNVTITDPPVPVIQYSNSPYCKDVSIQSVTLTGTNAFTGGSYSAASGLTLNPTNGAITPGTSDPGTYLITYETLASGGCTSVTTTTSVTINALPEPQIGDGLICVDKEGNTFRTFTFESGLSPSTYSFEWFLNNATIPTANASNYTATEIGNYSLIATNIATGCQSTKVSATVKRAYASENFIPYLTNTFTDNATLTVIVEGGTGPFLIQLDGGLFESNNIFTNLSPGTHVIKVTDINSCTDLTKEIIILDYPKFFTPNNDGYFDTWNIFKLSEQKDAKVYIYDRYGKLLKQISPSGEGWNGLHNGQQMPSDDYWFTVDYREMSIQGVMEWTKFKSHFSMKR